MTDEWIEREALVTVKAYPNPSVKYHESVCVAAITREDGWIRLYPVGFRNLPESQRFKKYHRVFVRMKRHPRDRRPESFRPAEDSIHLKDVISTKNAWRDRWAWVRPTIGPTMCELRRLERSEFRSLGCIKPRDVDRFIVKRAAADWEGKKQGIVDQLTLFSTESTKLEKIPYAFKYRYRCESADCSGHSQSIIDWELMELYRKLRDEESNESDLMEKIRAKYLEELCGTDKDTHFFVGNHSLFPKSFMVLGVFWPPKTEERTLF